ncbi:MAG: hypothetical protein DHS20C15_01590 [Planctomycetota bacterium]|nr:MAG: hypothetical protein DHS20C15_01590 [Planctomycetota bacterium]
MTLQTVVIESVCVLAAGALLGWGVNSARARGLDLERDYFPSAAPAQQSAPLATDDSVSSQAPGSAMSKRGPEHSGVDAPNEQATPPNAGDASPTEPSVNATLSVHQAQLVPHTDDPAAHAHAEDSGTLGDPLVIVGADHIDPGVHQRAVARLQSKGLRAIELDELQAFLADDMFGYGLFMLLDARRPDDFARSHLPGARHYDPYYPDELDEVLLSELQAASRVVVYCNGGDCEDSESAALQLLGAGVSPQALQVFVGGFEQWTLQELPLESPNSEHTDG